jgi:hypothetical protein
MKSKKNERALKDIEDAKVLYLHSTDDIGIEDPKARTWAKPVEPKPVERDPKPSDHAEE